MVDGPDNLTDVDYNNYVTADTNWVEGPRVCGNVSSARDCPVNATCLRVGPNPNYGYTSFDNMGASLLTVLQIITMDFWEDVYHKVLASTGLASLVFFLFAIFFGSFMMINLVLAVVAMNYTKASAADWAAHGASDGASDVSVRGTNKEEIQKKTRSKEPGKSDKIGEQTKDNRYIVNKRNQ